MNNSNQKYILLFLAILIIISVVVFFIFYKKDEEESNPSPSPSNQGNSSSPSPSPSPSKENKVSVKVTDDGVYIPDLPKKESYTQNEMPCDEIYDEDKDDGSFIPMLDTTTEWCDDLGIPINKKYEVVGYSYDDSLSSTMYDPDPQKIFAKHKGVGCKYGDDKKGCVYVEKRDTEGNTIGIQNYKGDNFLEIFWDGLQTHTKMRDFYKDEIFKNMEIKVENNKLHIRPKPTSLNCAEFTGKWFLMKPGINMSPVIGMQMTVLFLHIKGYPKDLVTFDININTLSKEEIDTNFSEEMRQLEKDPDDGGEDMCTDDIVYNRDDDDDMSSLPDTRTGTGTGVGGQTGQGSVQMAGIE